MDHGLLTIGSVFLVLAAILGLLLLGFELRKKEFPKVLGFLHPTLGLTGILMIVARHFIIGPLRFMDEGIVCLGIAVLFGLLLLLRGFGGQKMLRVFTVAHGVFGLLGLGLIVWQFIISRNLLG